MTVVTTTIGLPRGRPFTVPDLAGLPDDGNRYELLDGVLLVTPAPSTSHQVVVANLLVALHRSCPDDLRVLPAPFDVVLSDDTVVQPDLIVARMSDLTEANLPTAPLLAVEVLSPSTRGLDLLTKRDRLRRAGCASYWVVDPAAARVVAWELDTDGDYRQVADVTGEQSWTASRPFSVTVVPAALVQ